MYNFLDPKLMPKVTCTAPVTDHHEASNLINENEAIRARGFIAYSVTKPPVELEFEFLCPVNINFITLQTTVGRQKCTGIELFAKSETSSYVSIAKAVYDNPGLTFCDSRKYSKTNAPPFHDFNNGLFYFKSDQRRVFSDTSFLKVVIFRTNYSVPCLGSVKVFGLPSRSCSKVTVETVGKIMGVLPRSSSTNTVKELENGDGNGVQIPQDFLDDLTCEIMAIPMTLPSGKTVDRDTLEKQMEIEKSFGRKPCDPFTGLQFTESRKPVMNISLKSRIDMFLMQNSDNPVLFGLKRALGGHNMDRSTKRVKHGEEKTCKCCNCEQDQVLYLIPCQHYFCRNCLLNLNELQCVACGKTFLKSEAVRCYS